MAAVLRNLRVLKKHWPLHPWDGWAGALFHAFAKPRVASQSALALCLTFVGLSATAGCRPDSLFLRGDWGQARFSVEIADTDAERAIGLMNRDSMAKSSGMIFIYDHPQTVSFWMKNTRIPLDMMFLDPTGIVKHIHHTAIPNDLTPIPGGDGIFAVLEINGGLSTSMGITIGSEVQHPAFDANIAVWPCQ